MNGWAWLSTPRVTVAVRLANGIVVEAPPIVRRFIGQSIHNLVAWLEQQGELRKAWDAA